MKGFITADYEATLDSTIRVRECLPSDHLACFVVDAIAQLDLSHFYVHPETHNGVVYAPKILLGLLFHAYATGVFNSWKIEEATYESIPFRYIAGGLHPDHATISGFRKKFLPEIQESFVQVLILARTVGVLQLGTINLNGSEIHIDTPKGKAVSYQRLLELEIKLRQKVEKLLALGAQADQAGLPKDLVIEDDGTFRKDWQANLTGAKTALETFVQKRHGAGAVEHKDERHEQEEQTRQTDHEPAEHAPQSSILEPRGKDQDDPGSHVAENASYKYSCRTCPIRQRCIDTKGLGPGIKLAIARMFENHTDTHETWAKLQQDCLLVQEERRRAASEAQRESGLMRRLRQIQSNGTPAAKPGHVVPLTKRKPTMPAFPASWQSSNGTSAAKSNHIAPLTKHESALPAPSASRLPVRSSKTVPCGLTCLSTQRIVRLPDQGEIVLGRFEPSFSNPPDVDLAFDDGEIPSISRRHARITARGGRHWIEDLGSVNGTYLNGYQLTLGESVQLNPGDRIILGRCRMAYGSLPDWALRPDPSIPHTPTLVVTHTGQHIELPDKDESMVGRLDPSVAYTPDVDLSIAGNVAMHVSRRHIRLIARDGRHFLEGLGSAAGIRLNGRPVRTGEPPTLLQPNDQLWLGGCVVAYEWKLS